VVISNGANPFYSLNPYNMAASVIDEAIRNNIVCGGRRIALLDNFSWGNPEKPDLLAQLIEAVKGCYYTSIGFRTPFISGKDSLYNEYIGGENESTSILPTLLVSAVGVIPDIRKAVTMDVKHVGDSVYIIGETRPELGGSHYHLINNIHGGVIPKVDIISASKSYSTLTKMIDSGIITACHDCSEGGIGVAIAEMAIAGDLGINISLKKIPTSNIRRDDFILFSESNSRLLVTVHEDNVTEFETAMGKNIFSKIGEVTEDKRLMIQGLKRKTIVDDDITILRKIWKSCFDWIVM
jgi:phosphoribosylformylglycinamidine synthase